MRKRELFVFLLLLGKYFLCGSDIIRLNELSSTGGKFIISDNYIYTFDPKDYTIKIFSLRGELINIKSLNGGGPGEVSTMGGMIYRNGENLLILEPVKKRWIEYDKKLNFLREGRFDEPITVVKNMGKNLIGGNGGLEEGKYIKKIYLLSDNFKLKKEIYKEYGKFLENKIDSNEFYITVDATPELIAFRFGNTNKVRMIDINGNLQREISLNIKPTMYGKDSLYLIRKFLPQKIENFMEFTTYPFIFQVLFISNYELLIISGEMVHNDQAKGYIYNLNSETTKNKTLPIGVYCFHKGILYIISEDEEGCFLKDIRIK
jgi:hypothetical protein